MFQLASSPYSFLIFLSPFEFSIYSTLYFFTDSSGKDAAKRRCAPKNSVHTEHRKSSENLVFSAKVTAKLATRQRGFFDNLPLHKRLILLRYHRDSGYHSPFNTRKLAQEINVPTTALFGWINSQKSHAPKLSSIADISASKIKILCDEFSVSDDLTDDRALILGHVLRIPIHIIHEWFARRICERQAELACPLVRRHSSRQSESEGVSAEPKQIELEFPRPPVRQIEPQCPRPPPVRQAKPECPRRPPVKQPEPECPRPSPVRQTEPECPRPPPVRQAKPECLRRPPVKQPELKPSSSFEWQSHPAKPQPFETQPEADRRASIGFTANQYETLMDWFKRQMILSEEESDELALKTNLTSSQVKSWFQRQRRLMQSTTVNKILKNLSTNFHPDHLLQLEQRYRETLCISTEEAAELAFCWDIAEEAIILWFKRRRAYELYKSQGSYQTITEEHGIIRDILEAEDVDTMMSTANTEPESPEISVIWSRPAVRVSRCTLLAGRYELDERSPKKKKRRSRRTFTAKELEILKGVYAKQKYLSANEAENIAAQLGRGVRVKTVMNWFWIARNKDTEEEMSEPAVLIPKEETSVKSEPAVAIPKQKTHVQMNEPMATIPEESALTRLSSKKGPTPVAVQNALFEEYQKSPVLSKQRKMMLYQRLKVSPHRIHTFFQSLSSNLAGKTEASLFRALTYFANSQLSRLTLEYSKTRFVHVIRGLVLAKQIGTPRRFVCDWFQNARLYELLTNNRFSMDIVYAERRRLASSAIQSQPSEKPIRPVGKSVARLLRTEYLRDPNITDERIKAMGKHLHMKRDRIRQWYLQNYPSAGDQMEIEATEQSQYISVVRSRYSRYQLELMFDTFKSFPNPPPERVNDLSRRTNLSSSKIRDWFRRMNEKLCFVSSDILLADYRNQNLSELQVQALEEAFGQHPYENSKTVEFLAKQLKLKKELIRHWFLKRRYYELIVKVVPKENQSAVVGAGFSAKGSSDVEVVASGYDDVKVDVSNLCIDLEAAPYNCENITVGSFVEVKTEESESCSNEDQSSTPSSDSENSVYAAPSDRNSVFSQSDANQETNYSLSERLQQCFGLDECTEVSCSWPDMEIDPRYLNESNALSAPDVMIKSQISDALPSNLTTTGNPVEPFALVSRATTDPRDQPDYLLRLLTGESEELLDGSQPAVGDFTEPPTQYPELEVDYLLKLLSDDIDTDTLPDQSPSAKMEAKQNSSAEPKATSPEATKETFAFSPLQSRILWQEFKKSPFISATQARVLASDLNLSVSRVESWFEWRRSHKKGPQWVQAGEESHQSLTPWQLFVLDREFSQDLELTEKRVEYLSRKLKTTRQSVIAWYCERQHGDVNKTE